MIIRSSGYGWSWSETPIGRGWIMGPIVEITGADLAEIIRQATVAGDQDVYILRVAIDGGVKIKWNEYSWSPPMGTVTEGY